MRRTSIPLLVTLAILAGAIGWLGQVALAASGQATLTPPLTLVVVLFAMGAIVLAFGWPIRQWVRGKRDRPVDPFYNVNTPEDAAAAGQLAAQHPEA